MPNLKSLCYNKNMPRFGGRQGFTLIELSLAVGFISLLSLTVALIINDTVATYRRGLTLNNVNTTGMDIVDDMRSAIQNAPAKSLAFECEAMYPNTGDDIQQRQACEEDQARKLVVLEHEAEVKMRDDLTEVTIPVYGAICTGAYSYIWNSGYFFGENGEKGKVLGAEPATLTYTRNGETVNTADEGNFRLLKIKDEKRAVCKSALKEGATNYKNYSSFNPAEDLDNHFDITAVDSNADPNAIKYYDSTRTESHEVILADAETNPLALYDLVMTTPAVNSANEAAFYSVSFILGTLQGGLNVNAKGNFCETPTDYDEDFNYCAINKFNFAVQATGG